MLAQGKDDRADVLGYLFHKKEGIGAICRDMSRTSPDAEVESALAACERSHIQSPVLATCAVSHDTLSLVQPGRTGGMFLGQQLTRSRKTKVDKSLLITRSSPENVYGEASQDLRDMGKTGLFEVQSPIGTTCSPLLPRMKAML
jgi:hypothetical protein